MQKIIGIVVLVLSLSLILLHSHIFLICLHFTSVHLGAVTMATFKGLLKTNEDGISKGLLGPWKRSTV